MTEVVETFLIVGTIFAAPFVLMLALLPFVWTWERTNAALDGWFERHGLACLSKRESR